MKYLLVTALVLAVFWLWRHNRHAEQEQKEERDAAKRRSAVQRLPPVDIVECAVCGVHLPKTDALFGVNASYCCDAHRRQAGA